MAKLFLTQELAEQFAAALIAVIRSDHEIDTDEARAVQDVVSEMVENVAVDFADAMLLTVTPESFARAVGDARGGPYRGVSVSSPSDIAKNFSVAAQKVAAADGLVGGREARVVERYVRALDAPRR